MSLPRQCGSASARQLPLPEPQVLTTSHEPGFLLRTLRCVHRPSEHKHKGQHICILLSMLKHWPPAPTICILIYRPPHISSPSPPLRSQSGGGIRVRLIAERLLEGVVRHEEQQLLRVSPPRRSDSRARLRRARARVVRPCPRFGCSRGSVTSGGGIHFATDCRHDRRFLCACLPRMVLPAERARAQAVPVSVGFRPLAPATSSRQSRTPRRIPRRVPGGRAVV